MILKNPDLNLLQKHPKGQYTYLIQVLESLLKQMDARGKLVLPNLSAFTNGSMGIFSDYSGEGSGNYLTYSVLVCGYGYTSVFNDKLAQIREKYQLGETESHQEFRRGKLRAGFPTISSSPTNFQDFYVRLLLTAESRHSSAHATTQPSFAG